jgi:hypothetical protein
LPFMAATLLFLAPSTAEPGSMRIRIRHRPPMASIDGLRLDRFEPGRVYDVGTTLGILMLAERWAEPVLDETPALLVPLDEADVPQQPQRQSSARDTMPGPPRTPSNLVREFFPKDVDHLATAADSARTKRRRSR